MTDLVTTVTSDASAADAWLTQATSGLINTATSGIDTLDKEATSQAATVTAAAASSLNGANAAVRGILQSGSSLALQINAAPGHVYSTVTNSLTTDLNDAKSQLNADIGTSVNEATQYVTKASGQIAADVVAPLATIGNNFQQSVTNLTSLASTGINDIGSSLHALDSGLQSDIGLAVSAGENAVSGVEKAATTTVNGAVGEINWILIGLAGLAALTLWTVGRNSGVRVKGYAVG